jgi:hypothetical protein
MIERIVGFVCCLWCAVPFFIIAKYDKGSKEPIGFWSGDKTLRSKVKNIPEYNKEMAGLYGKCAVGFLLTGIGYGIFPYLGIALICLDCSVGFYLVWRNYKRILEKYS